MRKFEKGQTIRARGRDWTVVIPPEGDVDLLLADPHFTDEERSRIERVNKVNEKKYLAIPHSVYVQRAILDLSEIDKTSADIPAPVTGIYNLPISEN